MNNIAIVILSTGWGGLEMNTIKLALLLKEKGLSVTMFVREGSRMERESSPYFSLERIQKVRKHFDLKNALAISRILKKQNIQKVFTSNNKDLEIISFVKQLFYNQLTVIYQQHMQIGINKKGFIHTLRFKAINHWISPLVWLKNEVIQRTLFPQERIQVVPIGVDTNRFTRSDYSKKESLQVLDIHPKAPLIGIIGRITPKKGQDLLIEALLLLREKGIAIEVLIFGSATINDPESKQYEADLKKMVNDHALDSVVHFREAREDVELFYAAVDIFTMASESETYGMVTIEAMLAKVPIIATNTGGSPEILKGGTLGLLFKFGAVQEYVEKVQWILENNVQTNQMVQRAYQYALSEFSQETEASKIMNIIQQE